jgi:hypothetical protein
MTSIEYKSFNKANRGSFGEHVVYDYYSKKGHKVEFTRHLGIGADLRVDGQPYDVKSSNKYIDNDDQGKYASYSGKKVSGVTYISVYPHTTPEGVILVLSIGGKSVDKIDVEETKKLWVEWKNLKTSRKKPQNVAPPDDRKKMLVQKAVQTIGLTTKDRILFRGKKSAHTNALSVLPSIWADPDNKSAFTNYDRTVLLVANDEWTEIIECWIFDYKKDTETLRPLLKNDGRGKYRIPYKDFPKNLIHSVSIKL